MEKLTHVQRRETQMETTQGMDQGMLSVWEDPSSGFKGPD